MTDELEVQNWVVRFQDEKWVAEQSRRSREGIVKLMAPMVDSPRRMAEFFRETVGLQWERLDPTGAKREAWRRVHGAQPASPLAFVRSFFHPGTGAIELTRSMQRAGMQVGTTVAAPGATPGEQLDAGIAGGSTGPAAEERPPFLPSTDRVAAAPNAPADQSVRDETTQVRPGQGAQVPNKDNRRVKGPAGRNQRYKDIDKALRAFAESRPRTQEEVFRYLDREHVVTPLAEPFAKARGWIAGFGSDPATARAWLSKRWAELSLAPLPRGPKNPK